MQCSIAQHSTAQCSAAQHNTTQHNTTQHNIENRKPNTGYQTLPVKVQPYTLFISHQIVLFVFSGEEKAAGEQRGCNSGTHEQGETLLWKLGCTSRWGLHSINHVNCFLPSPSLPGYGEDQAPSHSSRTEADAGTVWHNKPPWLVHTLRLSRDSEERFRAHTWGQKLQVYFTSRTFALTFRIFN